MAVGDLRRTTLVWPASVDNGVSRIPTAKLTKLFAVRMGFHPLIEKVLGTETAKNTIQNVDIWIDPTPSPGEQLAPLYTLGGVDAKTVSGLRGFQLTKKYYFLTQDSGDTRPSSDFDAFHLYDELRLIKGGADAAWRITFTYRLVPGAMMWLDEWAELLRQKRNVPYQTSPGGRYHQVGDVHQVNRFNEFS